MRFIVRPDDIISIFDIFSENQYRGIIILCMCIIIAMLVMLVCNRRK